ncbi:hypothetical protein KL86PLE_130248 [uncultured Pleomorphomonas sp.]|uniref:Uncharacterized protein n=1 Tax=uncultured Pleomorphomonas sp. TaxID=442121 RepID=A0A212LAB9_9HYPH|nr:hypothetical protein KL86PLE_130248 [uncultured Pleomorphomonas sp.]
MPNRQKLTISAPRWAAFVYRLGH